MVVDNSHLIALLHNHCDPPWVAQLQRWSGDRGLHDLRTDGAMCRKIPQDKAEVGNDHVNWLSSLLNGDYRSVCLHYDRGKVQDAALSCSPFRYRHWYASSIT